MSYIDVKFRVDGKNVERGWGTCKMRYGVKSYPNHNDEGYSVHLDVKSIDMVKILEDMYILDDYEVVHRVTGKKVSV